MAETSDAARQGQTTHGALLPAEETWPLIDEYSTIRSLDLQVLSNQFKDLLGSATKSIRTTQQSK
jgi:hypothetical protein